MNNFQIKLTYSNSSYTSEESCSFHPDFDDALEEADDLAFSNTGFPLEGWRLLEFSDNSRLYFFYPNEEDKTSRFKLQISEASDE